MMNPPFSNPSFWIEPLNPKRQKNRTWYILIGRILCQSFGCLVLTVLLLKIFGGSSWVNQWFTNNTDFCKRAPAASHNSKVSKILRYHIGTFEVHAYGTNPWGWEISQNYSIIFKCSAPPCDQNGLCVEINLLSQKARGSPNISFIPLDLTWIPRKKHSRLG